MVRTEGPIFTQMVSLDFGQAGLYVAALSEELEALTREIVGADANAEIQELAPDRGGADRSTSRASRSSSTLVPSVERS